ncbi:MAG: aminodeoxychorismate synthase component I [Desulfobulbaceae bacterium]|uniref:Aminodeoxychorismate synthase component I n=1 Tax=Candidatus Desulfatifera sulfidica TaxID=2841691 RepID=A0A8J6TDG7_9BACT|nr:aminodeoxychorismate synthase component I [Candidatus Desulfatifera sulfidica]
MAIFSGSELDELLDFLEQQEDAVFLDSSRDEPGARSLLFSEPVGRLSCYRETDPNLFLSQIDEVLAQGLYAAGWVAYEFAYLLEERFRPFLAGTGDPTQPLAEFGIYQAPHVFDKSSTCPSLSSVSASPDLGQEVCKVSRIRPNQSRNAYLDALHAIRNYLKAGDTYQVNYTLKLLFDFAGSPAALYRRLRRNQSVAYGAFLRSHGQSLLSFSPELFFQKKGGRVTVRPMKGTMRRGRFVDEDAALAHMLCHDTKNRSENVMIVDLLRNDLGRLMHSLGGGSVQTQSLFDVERYETLWQMTSTIEARSDAQAMASLDTGNLFRALFPCGSITGAPKVRTMEIIHELEQENRGVYTGAIGYLAPDGDAVFNVPIRTVVIDGDRGEMGIGSGIVIESAPEQEWRECLLKARFLTNEGCDFQIIETLLWEPGAGYWLLESHLDRLMKSAEYFLFAGERGTITAALTETAKEFDNQAMRVRLLLAKDGEVRVTSMNCERPESRSLPVSLSDTVGELPKIRLAEEQIDSRMVWPYHKTTHRSMYDREYARAQEEGCLDSILLNERGEVCEGTITNVIVLQDGCWLTPPLETGLLPGVLRAELLRGKEVELRERVLTVADLAGAEAVYLCNSVRGLVRVRCAF